MRCWLLAVALALSLTASAAALAPVPVISWTHDGLNVTSFKCQIDTETAVTLESPTQVGTEYSIALSTCGTLTAGAHTITVQACNASGCTNAVALTVVKL